MPLTPLVERRIIWLILGLAFTVRMYHIDFPVAGFQGWRQADTAAMAKNFFENGFHLLSPQVDWGGNTPGYVETEFPIFSFSVALLYGIFWRSDIIGRLLSVSCSLITIFYLYLLVSKILGKRQAVWAAAVYALLPLNIYYGRAFMPEAMMLMFSTLGIYYFDRWVDSDRFRDFFGSALFVTLAALIKPPALYLGLPLLYLSLHKFGWRALRKPILWGYAVIVFVPLYLWYSHAHSVYLASGLTFGIWDYGQGKWGNWGSLATLKFYNDVFFKSIAERHLTYAGFVLFVVGLFIPRKNDRERLFDWWLIAILAYFCIVTTGNQVHEYYQLPFTLPAAVFMAKSLNACLSPGATKQEKGLPLIVKYVIYLALAVLPILGFIRYYHYMIGEQIDGAIFRLESAVKENIQHDSLVVAVDEGDPVILYRCGKKGWHSSPEELTKGYLEELHKKGAGYLVGLKNYFDSDSRIERLRLVLKQFRIVKQTDDYLILDLNSPLIL